MKLLDYFNAQTTEVLKKWLSMLKINTTGITRKEQMVAALEQRVRLQLPDYLSFLSAEEKAFLAECAHHGEVPSLEGFKAKYGRPVYPPVGDPWGAEARALKRYTDILVGRLYLGEIFELASELVQPLKDALPRPASVAVRGVAGLPTAMTHNGWGRSGPRPIHIHESEQVSQQELMRVLRLVQAGRIEVSDVSGRPTSSAIRAVTEILVVPDYDLNEPPIEANPAGYIRREPDQPGPVRAHAWPVVIQQCGWAKRRGKTLRLTPVGEGLIARFELSKFDEGVKRLTFDDAFDELSRIPAIRGQSGNAKRYLTPVGGRRATLCDHLRHVPGQTWISFSELVRYLRASGARWPVGGGQCLYLGELQYGALYEQAPLEAQYLRAFLMETWATLGLVDLAYTYPSGLFPELRDAWGKDMHYYISRYDGLLYLRITSLGAYVLAAADQKPTYQPPKVEAIYTLGPELELIPVLPQLESSIQVYLEQFAEPKSNGTWRIDERKILNHLAAGVSSETVLSWIKTGLATELPDGIVDLVAGLNIRREACSGMEDAVIIRWSDAKLVPLILGYQDVGKLAQAFGRSAIVTSRKNLTALRKALLTQGFVLPVEKPS